MEDLAREIVAQSKGGYSKLALSISSSWTQPVLLFTSRDASDMLLYHVLKRRNGQTKAYQFDYANFDAVAEFISTVLKDVQNVQIALVFYDKGIVGDQVEVIQYSSLLKNRISNFHALLKDKVKLLDVKGVSEVELGSST